MSANFVELLRPSGPSHYINISSFRFIRFKEWRENIGFHGLIRMRGPDNGDPTEDFCEYHYVGDDTEELYHHQKKSLIEAMLYWRKA